MATIHGNAIGLKASQVRALERIYRRTIPTNELITSELCRYLSNLSFELRRQIGIIVDRRGTVLHVILGDDREIVIPNLFGYGLGRSGLRSLRCIHTHLDSSPLSQDDLNDLSLLRLDLIAALGVDAQGEPSELYWAHLLPPNPDGETVNCFQAPDIHRLHLDFDHFITSLEDELERGMAATVDLEDPRERAILVSVSQEPRHQMLESLAELDELARTAELVVLDQILQRAHKIHPRYLMGQGKIREVVIQALQMGATLLVFDQDLSPAQASAIAAMTEVKVIDRSQLILDIFARRAHTRDGKVQVELAQLKYILPRLTGRGTALSRLMGGIGGRGPGETKLEIDRRRIRDRIIKLEKELKNLSRGRLQRRRKRVRSGLPIISIVGYTNAGKSTLLNALTQSETFTEDLLFATLDTASRRLRFPEEREVIITDTVGFIRQLPKSLFGAFKATLEEMADADLLLHLVDLSNPQFQEQISAVENILADLDLGLTQRLLVFNKIDQVPDEELIAYCRRFEAVPICALRRETFQDLMAGLQKRLWPE